MSVWRIDRRVLHARNDVSVCHDVLGRVYESAAFELTMARRSNTGDLHDRSPRQRDGATVGDARVRRRHLDNVFGRDRAEHLREAVLVE
jgi:hypothetical protein